MSDFRFANPQWVHALWLVFGLVATLVWLDRRKGTALHRLLSQSMQSRLVRRVPTGRRWISILLLGLATTALVVALMRPQWGLTHLRVPRVGAQIMVCLDVSKSMLAEDTAPNRLERAKAELVDLLAFLEGDQVGLIAFAGRATVLCPMTPDFGFFRMILDEAGPYSVGRGGTQLAEPIKKALDGFRTESDVSRAILLVTDGEDHDSFAVDAAKSASERGIKMIAVGFGDEAGSEIQVTDPETGLHSVLRDRDGQTVISHLDGETLREMALITEGAYVPAGTGVLDLQAIYEEHLAPLMRGNLSDRGHAVRRDGFQWAILCGLVLLVASVFVTSSSAAGTAGQPAIGTRSVPEGSTAAATVILALLAANSVNAQVVGVQEDSDSSAPPAAESTEAAQDAGPKTEPTKASEEEADPRDTYNEALAMLDTDLDRAERLFTRARRDSGADGEVRFRATYNMGWVEVKRADEALADNPQQALKHLRNAADWFRDAIRLRKDHRDARHNLDVVLRRILELTDSLAKEDQPDLTKRLDELIEGQRRLLGELRGVVEQVAGVDDPNAPDRFRSEFRRLAVQQRANLSDGQVLLKLGREELDAIESKKIEEQTPEERVRAVQLTNLLHYANRANQRMGQSRSQMRRRVGDRAYRRASAALNELKRARDQLRNPVEVLGVLLGDSATLAQFTAALAGWEAAVPGSNTPESPPAWLTPKYLEETQQSITERAAEIEARLQAAVAQQKAQPAGAPTRDDAASTADTERLLAKVREALPYITEGKEAFTAAQTSLGTSELEKASEQQVDAIAALQNARERFLELRGLIELTYAQQSQIAQLLTPGGDEQPEEHVNELLMLAGDVQETNIERLDRLALLVDEEIDNLAKASSGAPRGDSEEEANAPDEQTTKAEAERLALAKQLVQMARSEMDNAKKGMDAFETETERPDEGADETEPKAEPEDAIDPPLSQARSSADQAVEHLQALRRLFFSIVEHLRETAQRQSQLNDETEQARALSEAKELLTQIGPLVPRQRELQTLSSQIAEALKEQSKQNPAAAAEPEKSADPQQLQQMQQLSAKFAQAGELVREASGAMEQATDTMDTELSDDNDADALKRELETARGQQDTALQKLAEALALLAPPQGDQQQEQQQDRQQQGEDKEQEQAQQAGADPSRLLQAVRDREARRRKDRTRQQRQDDEQVEKDW